MATQSSGKIPSSREERKRLSKSRRLFEEYLIRQDEGESVNPEEYLKKYPELEEDLKVLFHQLDEKMAKEEDLLSSGAENGRPKVLGDFQILKKIGSGGMASVFEAEQISLKRRVALKVLPAHLSFSDEAVKKFKREAEAGGRQCHPGIVSIFSVGEQDGMHFIAQELVRGGRNLHDQLEDLRKLDDQPIGYFREAALLVAEVAEALADAHESGVVHRDVKPSNILLTEDGRPMLTDFGLAKVQDAMSLSRTGEFAGTPFYMSPEQAMSRRIGIDHRTDVYSLGVTLYEMLTLKRPFDGKTSHEVLKKIILIEPKNPCRLNPRVPRDLAVICLKAMEKDPARRYQTMAEFGSDLHRFLNAELIRAKPSPICTRVIKYVRRHPVCSVAVGVAFLGLVALVGSQLWASVKIQKKERALNRVVNSMYTMLVHPLTRPEVGRFGTTVKTDDIEQRLILALKNMEAMEVDTDIDLHLRAHLLWQHGNFAMSIGDVSRAMELLRKAVGLFNEVGGESHTYKLMVKNDLALVLADQGFYGEAEHLLREVLEAWSAAFTEDDAYTLSVMDSLAGIMGRRGKLREAEGLHRKALEKYTGLLGEKDLDALTCMNNLAGVLADLGEYGEAEMLFRKVLRERGKQLGEKNLLTIRSLSNLGALLVRKGEIDEAEALLGEALAAQTDFLPRNHPDRLATLSSLAGVLKDTGRLEEAEACFMEALELREGVLEERHPLILQSRYNLAVFFMDLKEESKAGALLEAMLQVLDENEEEQGFEKRDYADWHIWKMAVVDQYISQKRFSEALSLGREILAWRRNAFGNDRLITLKCMERLIFIFLIMGLEIEADSVLTEAVDIAERTLEPEHFNRLFIQFMMGGRLFQKKEFKNAEPYALASFEGFKATKGLKDNGTQKSLNLLCMIYRELDEKEKVKKYQSMLLPPE